MSSKQMRTILVFALVLIAFTSAISAPIEGATVVANVSFATTVDDTFASKLLAEHRARPRCAYMISYGLRGTHRTYLSQKDPQKFMVEVRQNAHETLTRGIEGNNIRIKEFITKYELTNLEEDNETLIEARSLLNTRMALIKSLNAVRAGNPIVFSLEVTMPITRIKHLRNSLGVKRLDWNYEKSAKAESAQPEVPPQYAFEFSDERIERMKPEKLYESMQKIVAKLETH